MNRIYLNLQQEVIPPGLTLNELFVLQCIEQKKWMGNKLFYEAYPALFKNERAVATLIKKLRDLGFVEGLGDNLRLTEKARAIFPKEPPTRPADLLAKAGLTPGTLKKIYDVILGPKRPEQVKEQIKRQLLKTLKQHRAIIEDISPLYSDKKIFKQIQDFDTFLYFYIQYLEKHYQTVEVYFLHMTKNSAIFSKYYTSLYDKYRIWLFPPKKERERLLKKQQRKI